MANEERGTRSLVRAAALAVGACGFLAILDRGMEYMATFTALRDGAAIVGPLVTLVMIAHLVVPFLKVWIAAGLWIGFPSARPTALVILAVDVAVAAVIALRFFGSAGVSPPPNMDRMTVVEVVNLWPAWVTAVISLAALIILIRAGRSAAGSASGAPTSASGSNA